MMLFQAATISFDFSSTFVLQGLSALGEGRKQQLTEFKHIFIYMLNDTTMELRIYYYTLAFSSTA